VRARSLSEEPGLAASKDARPQQSADQWTSSVNTVSGRSQRHLAPLSSYRLGFHLKSDMQQQTPPRRAGSPRAFASASAVMAARPAVGFLGPWIGLAGGHARAQRRRSRDTGTSEDRARYRHQVLSGLGIVRAGTR
jgi:hypothetical protein